MSQVLRLVPQCISRGSIAVGCRYRFWRFTACPFCTLSRRGCVIDTNGTVSHVSGTVSHVSGTVSRVSGTVSQSLKHPMSTGAPRAQFKEHMQKWKKRKNHQVDRAKQEPTLELVQVLNSRVQQLTGVGREGAMQKFNDPTLETNTGQQIKQKTLNCGLQASTLNKKSDNLHIQVEQNSADKSDKQSSHKGQAVHSAVKLKNTPKVKSKGQKQSNSQDKVKKNYSSQKKTSKGKSSKKLKQDLSSIKEDAKHESAVILEEAVLLDADPTDLHDNLIVETLPDESVADEMQMMLNDPTLRHSLSKDMRQYLKRMRRKVVKDNQLPPAPFWDPAKLADMAHVAQALEDLKKANLHPLRNILYKIALHNDAKMSQKAAIAEQTAYVQACINSNRSGGSILGDIKSQHKNGVTMLQKAHIFIMANGVDRKLDRKRRQTRVITDPDVYVILMKAWAKQKNLERIRQLFDLMDKSGIELPLSAFVAALECLGRQEVVLPEVASRIVRDISTNGFELNDIPSVCLLQMDEWLAVKRAILEVVPEYCPFPIQTSSVYDSPLLQSLNTKRLESGEQVNNPNFGVLNTEELWERCQKQMDIQQASTVKVKSIQQRKVKTAQVHKARCILDSAKENWRQALLRAFEQDLSVEKKKTQTGEHALSLVPYLMLLPPDDYVELMMQEVEYLSQEMEAHSPSIGYLNKALGLKVFQKHCLCHRQDTGFTEQVLRIMKDYLEKVNMPNLDGSSHREHWYQAVNIHNQGLNLDLPHSYWPPHIAKAVGRFLYKIILCDVKVDTNMFKETQDKSETPAFYKVYRYDPELKAKEVIKPHPVLVRLYDEACMEELVFSNSVVPSLVPPLPWVTPRLGGDMLGLTDFIKNPSHTPQQVARLQDIPVSQLNPVFDSLNVLSATPWKINKTMLDIVIHVFNNGGDETMDVPPPASSGPEPPHFTQGMDQWERLNVMKEREKVKQKRAQMHSLWMTEVYRLSIANQFRDEVFYFPHNLDFRGRVYAVPPHFNHLGSDLARSLLLLGKGKPLGPKGLDWLKIHLVNLTGLKKRTANVDRLAFAEEIMPEILESADRPLTGNKWWQSSDEPWQTLACCVEIANAVRSPDPASYVSHYAVHQDGSCNGLQHYAALGRDRTGAKSVNLAASDIPNDVYSDVVELVEKERAKDAAAGNEVAKQLEGFVRRKVIKQTIMTTVYGVTKFGAKLQIQGQLEDIADFPQDQVFKSALYLADKTFHCLQQMFTATKEIQEWLTICANLASTVSFQPVEWETPLGLPVIQPYFTSMKFHSKKNPGKLVTLEKPSMQKQRNAFPPNFIHSLDSCHMMLTALHCYKAGITFVSVHDCYWTHACDVDFMNKICREQFVALHKQPILEDLASFMLKKYGLPDKQDTTESERNHLCAAVLLKVIAIVEVLPCLADFSWNKIDPVTQNFVNHVLTRVPERGTFELENVLDSTYFFS